LSAVCFCSLSFFLFFLSAPQAGSSHACSAGGEARTPHPGPRLYIYVIYNNTNYVSYILFRAWRSKDTKCRTKVIDIIHVCMCVCVYVYILCMYVCVCVCICVCVYVYILCQGHRDNVYVCVNIVSRVAKPGHRIRDQGHGYFYYVYLGTDL
jgi:hypothetical protein